MTFSVVSGNHWSCVHIILETGDGLYADSIGREVPRYLEDTFSNVFQPIYEKHMTLINPCRLLMKLNQQKHAQMWIFSCKKMHLSKNGMTVCGAAAIFPAITMSDFTIATEIIRKRKNDS